jgi:C-3',4' desaturase CrtD
MKDVAVIGAGMAGMATAARLQAQGLATIVLEAHGQPGGCAGFFRRKGFAFDVGATTLVDFEPGGVGHELFESIGMASLPAEALPGYMAWLPDRVVTLHRAADRWADERLSVLGDSAAHRAFWSLLDRLADAFWRASRRGISLPIQRFDDVRRVLHALRPTDALLARYAFWTMGDALRKFGLRQDRALVTLLSMLIEDTVHSCVEEAPLINAALGVTIRGAGLTRATGGMWGFWRRFVAHYRDIGGELRLGCPVESVTGRQGAFVLKTRQGDFQAAQVVSAVPIQLTACLAPQVSGALRPYLQRDADALGGAAVVFLGVPEAQVTTQAFTHQIFQDYDLPLGNGNNMFVSVSAPGDIESAPEGHRAVMISTHCELAPWEGLSQEQYACQKRAIGDRLTALARRVYPALGRDALVYEIGTPRTYARFTRRPRGAVGGVRQTLHNSNQNAVPHDVGVPGFWLAGDTTWPGLGTVACVLSSRLVAESTLRAARKAMCRTSFGVSFGPEGVNL